MGLELRIFDLENHFDKKIEKLREEIKKTNTNESGLRKTVDKKFEILEQHVDERFSQAQSQMSKLETIVSLHHEYAEIKRQGDKLRALELKVVDIQRDTN